MNFEFTPKLKNEIFNLVIKQDDPFGQKVTENGILTFLLKIWDLRSMPSEEQRSNAYEDTVQHTINNDDWDYQYIFYKRFNLFEDDIAFQHFIEALLHPEIRITEDEIQLYYFLLNPYFENVNYSLTIIDYNSLELPIYNLTISSNSNNIAVDFKQNNIPFFVDKVPSGWSDKASSHKAPPSKPCFVLALKDWNDYNQYNEFSLFYYEKDSYPIYIGDTKIIPSDGNSSLNTLPNDFLQLDENFCSLGQTFRFYNRLKDCSAIHFMSVLWALKDAAFFSHIYEKFEGVPSFKNSLIRFDEPERLLREAKYQIYGYDLSNLYRFKYFFNPIFSDRTIEIDFNFENKTSFSNRIYALIGKNGTGKTQLITSLPNDLYKKKDEQFSPRTPLFSKIIAVSYSSFDSFEIPNKTTSFNYVYCGLKGEKGEQIDNQGQLLRFHNSWKKIKFVGRMEKWILILQNFIEQEVIDGFIDYDTPDGVVVNLIGFKKTRDILSSGQSITLYIITEIIANIRFDSIILYDEPETHLHPNAISELMNTIYELVNEFQSYCIIATHSPLIIRELLSKNVLVIERDGDIPSIRKIGIQSFGENLTVLTNEVFGNRSIPKQYKIIIEKMLRSGLNIDQVTEELESDGLPLSLNASIYLNSLVDEKS